MLTIYCGDNSVASRDAFSQAKKVAAISGNSVTEIESSELLEIEKSGGSAASDLFGGRPVYITTNLVKVLKRKLVRKTKDKLRELSASEEIEIIDWEDSSAYDLGIDKDKFSFVKDYKLAVSTFTLLPKLKPKNAQNFLSELQELAKAQPIEVTIAMLMRHVKSMLLLKSGKSVRDNPYLVRLASSGSAHFTLPQLLEIYKRLLRADINVKTGRGTPLSIKEQVETIIAFLL